MEGVLLQSRGGGAVFPAQRSLRRQYNRQLCARASARGVRKLAVSLDKLRLTRDATVGGAADDHHVDVNGRAAAAVEVEKLRAVAEAAADRAEMHDIVSRQRDGWNHLLLHSTNSLALAGSVMAALAPGAEPTTLLLALKASAGALLATTAVAMAAAGKVQPSQLAEEQRNATRLWRQLERDVRAALRQSATDADVVHHAVDRVLALDAAYPLPLLPQMLDKFPEAVEPTRWWPRRQPRKKPARSPTVVNGRATVRAGNGWTPELEDEMRGIARAIRAKDEAEYVSNAKLALALNRGLAVAGPALAGAAALAAVFIVSTGSWASGAAVVGGALAAAVNTVEHGAQVGMVFETFRNVAGTYRKIREDIEANLDEPDAELRESGEVFQTKVALLLGRSASDLQLFRDMASPSFKDEDIEDFAGKLL